MTQAHKSRHLLSTLFLFLGVVRSQSCYFPDGSAAGSSYAPCPSSNGTGPCCYSSGPSLTDLCYSNGFCYSVVLGKIYRGGCTDQSWGSDSGCAVQCLKTSASGTIDVSPCFDTKICCGDGDNVTSCCASGDGFAWDNATFLSQSVELTTTTSTTTVSATATTSTATAMAAATATGQTSATTSVAVNDCHNQTVALGAGLGVPLGLALLSVAWLASRLFALRRRDRPQSTGTAMWPPNVAPQKYAEKAELPNHPITELPASGASVTSGPMTSGPMTTSSRSYTTEVHPSDGAH